MTNRRSHDEEFTLWVDASYPRLLQTAFLIVGDRDQAEDLLQTVLAKLYLRWDSLGDVRERGLLIAYTRTALTRQATSWWRRAWRAERPTEVIPEPPGGGRAGDVDRWIERDRLVRHLAKLPARQRAAVVLRYLDDLSELDTAAALGCSVGAVKAHTHRGVNRLRELMAAEMADDEREGVR